MTGSYASWAACLIGAGALLFLNAGCGRKGPPRPASEVLPETITDLAARVTPAGIQLSWTRPTKYSGGDRMPDLGGFLVQRSTSASFHFETVATIDVTDRERFQKATRFRHIDGTVVAGEEYGYRVVSFTLDRYFSAPSNIVVVRNTPQGSRNDATGSTPE